jgi:hypothetical protein
MGEIGGEQGLVVKYYKNQAVLPIQTLVKVGFYFTSQRGLYFGGRVDLFNSKGKKRSY